MESLKRGFYVGLAIFLLVGMLVAQTQNEKTTIISKATAIVGRTGLIYEASFLQTYPRISYPVLFDANQTNMTYPYAFSWEVYNYYYNFAINETHNASNASIIFVPLGIKTPDDLDDWAISIAISKAHTYAKSKYSIVFSFVGTEAHLEAIVATINALEDLGIEYSIYGFSHGVLNNETHGVIMYDASMTPIVVNGEVLSRFTENPKHLDELLATQIFDITNTVSTLLLIANMIRVAIEAGTMGIGAIITKVVLPAIAMLVIQYVLPQAIKSCALITFLVGDP